MRNWDAKDWALFVLVLTIPLTLLLLTISAVVSQERMAPETANFIGDFLKVLAGGVIGIIAGHKK
jgi:hypothetical protein